MHTKILLLQNGADHIWRYSGPRIGVRECRFMAEPGRTIQLTENRTNRCNILLQHNHEAGINRGIGYSSPRCLVSGLQSWSTGRRALPISAEFPQKSSLADWLDRRRRHTAKEAKVMAGQITQKILRETTCVRPIPEITTILSITLQSFSRNQYPTYRVS